MRIDVNTLPVKDIIQDISEKLGTPVRNKSGELTINIPEEFGEGFIRGSSFDSGIGIDFERNRDKLFGLYKTFSSNPNSRSVGLFKTKNQIDAMDGNIGVESEPGKGTKVKLYFK